MRAGPRLALSLVAVSGCMAAAAGAHEFYALSELLVNPSSTNQGMEFVEITGEPGKVLDGFFFIVIEGDGASVGGTIDQKVDLSGIKLGSNGLLLIRDSDTILEPQPDSDTTVVIHDFDPDIENGTNTYVLGEGVFPDQGANIDADRDGAIDADVDLSGWKTWDAVSYKDADLDDLEYADDLGGTALGQAMAFAPGALYRVFDSAPDPNIWCGGQIIGTSPGPFTFSDTNFFGWDTLGIDPAARTLDPGTFNYVLCDSPEIFVNPKDTEVDAGASASFSVTAVGGDLSYRWRKDSVEIFDGGTISGADTATLTIDPAAEADEGEYDVVVSNDCGSATSSGATLTVKDATCKPDCNGDRLLNINDFICMQAKWRAKDPYGDYDGSGTYTINDFIRFQADWQRVKASGGCP